MKIRLSKSEMLERRRLAAGLEPLRADCRIEYTDGIDVDRLLEQDLRARSVRPLDTAAESCLAPENIADVRSETCGEGGMRIVVPDNCRRVLALEGEGWQRSVPVQGAEHYERVWGKQYNGYVAATGLVPVAVRGPDGCVYAWPAGRVKSLRVVTDPGEEYYVLDESGLKYLLEDGKGDT